MHLSGSTFVLRKSLLCRRASNQQSHASCIAVCQTKNVIAFGIEFGFCLHIRFTLALQTCVILHLSHPVNLLFPASLPTGLDCYAYKSTGVAYTLRAHWLLSMLQRYLAVLVLERLKMETAMGRKAHLCSGKGSPASR